MDLRWRGKGKKKKKAGFVFIELKVAWGRVSVAQSVSFIKIREGVIVKSRDS